ncbi:MAG: peptidase M22 [Clostridiales bacterium]|nr:peptidase M22 [Clostridiales bacterium]
MSAFFGIDTSNYTTSAAIEKNGEILQRKMLLPVKRGERGLRQSEAVYHHVMQLPEVCKTLLGDEEITAVGVSFAPRRVKGSYMPCFNVGLGFAEFLCDALKVPMYKFSHQEGHIAAALYSANKLDLFDDQFLAFHISGGTTDAILVSPGDNNIIDCQILATSLDLHAGQLIDRVGVMLGLNFPCGGELEKLALEYGDRIKVKPCVKGFDICLSGVENICRKMFDDGESKQKIAAVCIEYIACSIDICTHRIIQIYSGLPIIYSGGVMRNSIIKNRLSKKYNAYFAQPDFSSDNAAGIAVLAKTAYDRAKYIKP